MTPGGTLALSLAGMFALAVLAIPLTKVLGRNAGYPLAAGFALAAAGIGLQTPGVLAGEDVSASIAWLPSVGIGMTVALDGLSLLFSLLVLGVGVLVMAYSARYFRPGTSPGRLYAFLTLFAASMLGLVVSADLIALFIFWELTSVTSFFLIGGAGGSAASKGATRAFLVTALGGLALLAGLILLGVSAGTFDLRAILADADAVRAHALAPAVMVLVILGAFTKSAQWPFHFWLPGAMVAPTPVSTYLHAATMVKAGIYLLARLSPIYAGEPGWLYPLVFVGLFTAVLGAFLALKQYDLKSLLAYSTVSQLGFIVALIGVGTPHAMAAASIHILAHAAYKATLFMVVGIIDVEAGSRDIRHLSGLRKVMPITATITGFAALSMAGIPPFLGFVSKEEAFAAFLEAPAWAGPVAGGLAVTASMMTFAYGARIVDGAFGGPLVQELYEPRRSFKAPAAVTAFAGLAVGAVIPVLDAFVGSAAGAALGRTVDVHLHLWHGFEPALWMSMVTIVVGSTLFLVRRRVDRVLDPVTSPISGSTVFDRTYDGIIALGKQVGRPFAVTPPAVHLLWVLGTAGVASLGAWIAFGAIPRDPGPPAQPEDWVVLIGLVLAATAIVTATKRLAAVAVLGIAGFLVAILYVVLGAPDLALTQLLIETLTVTLIVLVFRRLRESFRRVPLWRKAGAAVIALGAGAISAYGTWTLTGHRPLSDAGAYYLEAAPDDAGGHNVVNTILVDFRALDTLGELTVLAAAGIGVYAMVRLVRRDP